MEKISSVIKIRMSHEGALCNGTLITKAHIIHIFGDAATEISIKYDGDEGLFLRYNEIEFFESVYVGDYIEVYGELIAVGNTSRKMEFFAKKTIATRPDRCASAADYLEEPVLIAHAIAIGVTLKELKRK